MARIAGLVQARMGSTRLPGKVMLPICGEPLIGHIFDRLEKVPGLCGTVLATTVDSRNDAMAAYARDRNITVYRENNEEDLAARLIGAAHALQCDAILKINGDCPLVDVALMQRHVLAFKSAEDVDYVSNKIKWTFPEGLSTEVISTRALAWCDENLTKAEDRHLVANWIRDHPQRFKVMSITGERDLSRYQWTVDTPEDYVFVTRIFQALERDNHFFGLNDILAHLELLGGTGSSER
jgi:spore coat polysaccharide biosynthesis protein SpsF